MIDRLTDLNIPMSIATSSNHEIVEAKKRVHPSIFDKVNKVVCGDDPEVVSGKPDPDIFLLAGDSMCEITS